MCTKDVDGTIQYTESSVWLDFCSVLFSCIFFFFGGFISFLCDWDWNKKWRQSECASSQNLNNNVHTHTYTSTVKKNYIFLRWNCHLQLHNNMYIWDICLVLSQFLFPVNSCESVWVSFIRNVHFVQPHNSIGFCEFSIDKNGWIDLCKLYDYSDDHSFSLRCAVWEYKEE